MARVKKMIGHVPEGSLKIRLERPIVLRVVLKLVE